MDFVLGASVFAGLAATFVMTTLLYAARFLIPDRMPMNLLFLLGTVVRGNPRLIYLTGGVIHVSIGIFSAVVHTAIYAASGLESALAWWGLLLGLGQWITASVLVGRLESTHPLVKAGRLPMAGYFAARLPVMNAIVLLIGHLLFGMVVGGFYQTLA